MKGYDLKLIKKISENLSIPIVALGGAGNVDDFRKAYVEANESGLLPVLHPRQECTDFLLWHQQSFSCWESEVDQ